MNWRGDGRKRSWPKFKALFSIFLEGLRKPTKILRQENQSGPKFEPGISRIRVTSDNH
jgi:hypothetical protein